MAVEFTDNSVHVQAELKEAIIAYLHEAGGEMASQTKRNSRPLKYGKHDVKNSWEYRVDEEKQVAQVGSTLEAAFWEELGTGEFALNHDGRKGWWVYVEGNDTPTSNGKIYTEAEAQDAAAFLRSKGLDAHATQGTEANRPLFRAFTENKNALIRRAEELLKARMDEQ